MQCNNQDCLNETNENYKYCTDCYNRWRANQTIVQAPTARPTSPPQWHTDPVVDSLQKINANLGKLVASIERLENAYQLVNILDEKKPKTPKKKTAKKPVQEEVEEYEEVDLDDL